MMFLTTTTAKALAYIATMLIAQIYAATDETAAKSQKPWQAIPCVKREEAFVKRPISTEKGIQNLDFNLCDTTAGHFWTQIFYDLDNKRKCIFVDHISLLHPPKTPKYPEKHVEKIKTFKKYAAQSGHNIDVKIFDISNLDYVVHWNREYHCIDIALYLRLLLEDVRKVWESPKTSDGVELTETDLFNLIDDASRDLSVAASTYGLIESFENILVELIPKRRDQFQVPLSQSDYARSFRCLAGILAPCRGLADMDPETQKPRMESKLRFLLSEQMISAKFAQTYPRLGSVKCEKAGGIMGYMQAQDMWLRKVYKTRCGRNGFREAVINICNEGESLEDALSMTQNLLEDSPIFDEGPTVDLTAHLVLADHIFRFYGDVSDAEWIRNLPEDTDTITKTPRFCLAEIILREYVSDLYAEAQDDIKPGVASANGASVEA